MSKELKIGRVSYSIDAMRSMTLEEALKAHENHPVIKPDDIKKAWKCCNGHSKPNHLKDQLEGLKPVKRRKATEDSEKKDKKEKAPKGE